MTVATRDIEIARWIQQLSDGCDQPNCDDELCASGRCKKQ